MQGRLSPLVDGRIQGFPWTCWQAEFALAARVGFRLMEWTLDQDRLYENPLLTAAGRSEIRTLCERHGLTIPSVTGDCFMQAPFWKARGSERQLLQRDFMAVAEACAALGISMIVVPLVDNGRLEDPAQQDTLVRFLQYQSQFLTRAGLRVLFECNFSCAELASFIRLLDPALFGINYDIGNSAAAGFSPAVECAAYGHRIANVHVKDRVFGGGTVPLGTGDVDFEAVFAAFATLHYAGNYVLQTARAADGDHVSALCRYRDMTADWVSRHGA